jgi:hypothetical protein
MTTGSLDSYERGDDLEYAYGSASGRCFAVWHPGDVKRISRIGDEVSLAILVGVVSVHRTYYEQAYTYIFKGLLLLRA